MSAADRVGAGGVELDRRETLGHAVGGDLGRGLGVAGLLRTSADGRLPAGSTVVCTVTGHGLKDPDTALAAMTAPVAATSLWVRGKEL